MNKVEQPKEFYMYMVNNYQLWNYSTKKVNDNVHILKL